MADKVKCPKCGKLCGATYLERHKAKCKGTDGVNNMSTEIPTEEVNDIEFDVADLVAEIVDVEEQNLDSGELPNGDQDPTEEMTEQTEGHGAGGAAIAAIVAGVMLIVLMIVGLKMVLKGETDNES